MAYQSSKKRRNIVNYECFKYVRETHPKLLQEFRQLAEQRFPVLKPGPKAMAKGAGA